MSVVASAQDAAEIQATLALLTHSAPSVSTGSNLKEQLFERINTPQAVTSPILPRSMIDFSSIEWQLTDPGVSVHLLRRDAATGTITTLVKIEPGAKAVTHLHRGGEENLVSQGGFRDRRGEFQAGDFVYYEPGSIHYDLQALEGEACILFVVAHGGIEMLPATL